MRASTNTYKFIFIIFAFMFCFVNQAKPQNDNPYDTDIQYVIQDIDMIYKYHQLSGLSVCMTTDEDVVFYKDWSNSKLSDSNIQDQIKVTKAGNISHLFLAISVLQLAQQNKIDLLKPANIYLPGLQPDITILNLLEHTAGLEHYPHHTILARKAFLKNSLRLPDNVNTLWKPNTQYAYSELGYMLIAKIIEAVSHKTFQDYIQENICKPLQLKNTGFLPAEGVSITKIKRICSIKDFSENPFMNPFEHPLNQFYTTGEDMSVVLRFLLYNNPDYPSPVLSGSWVERMKYPGTGLIGSKGIETGFGPGLLCTEINGIKAYALKSFSATNMASFIIIPELNRGWFIALDTFNPIALSEIESLLAAFASQYYNTFKPQAWGIEDNFSDIYSGYYQTATYSSRFRSIIQIPFGCLKLQMKGDTVVLKKQYASEVQLIASGTNVFREIDNVYPSFFIGEDNKKQCIVSTEGQYVRVSSIYYFARLIICSMALLASILSFFFCIAMLIARISNSHIRLTNPIPVILSALTSLSIFSFFILSFYYPCGFIFPNHLNISLLIALSWITPILCILSGISVIHFSYSYRKRWKFIILLIAFFAHLIINVWLGISGSLALQFWL